MRHINYKSDFDFLLKLVSSVKQEDGSCVLQEVGFPGYDWEATFWTSRRSTSFVASSKGGVLTNCFNDAGQIHIVCNNRGLGPGVLYVEFRAHIPNSMYPDGCADLFSVLPLDIELVVGCSDCFEQAEATIALPEVLAEIDINVARINTDIYSLQTEVANLRTDVAAKEEVIAALNAEIEMLHTITDECRPHVIVEALSKDSVFYIDDNPVSLQKGTNKLYFRERFSPNPKTGQCSNPGITSVDMRNAFFRYPSELFRLTFEMCEDLTSILGLENIPMTKLSCLAGFFSRVAVPGTFSRPGSWDLSNIESMKQMFYRTKFSKILMNGVDAPKLTTMSSMFLQNTNVQTIQITNWNAPNLTDMSYLFSGCTVLSSLSLGGWDFRNVTNMTGMFNSCIALKTISGTLRNIGVSISLSACPLTASSGRAIISGLATVEEPRTLTLKASTYELLTEGNIAIATSKGWTVASA